MVDIKIKKHYSYDVAVIGGGTAGVFAAISAARSGARTVLIEKNSTLGGTMTSGGVNYPGLFYAWGKRIISGPCIEAIDRINKLGGAVIPDIPYAPQEHWKQQILLDRFLLTAVLFEMCEEAGVDVILNTMLTHAEDRDSDVLLYITEKDGLSEIVAKNAVDCTGDATAVSLAGYHAVKSEIQQPATLTNAISGYDISKVCLDDIEKRLKDENFPAHVNARRLKKWLIEGRLNIHVPSADAHTSEGKTQVERDAYALLLRLYRFLRTIKGLEELKISYVAAEAGIRETVRIVGEETVSVEDYLSGKHFDDSVCYAFYPIDLHVSDGVKMTYHQPEAVPRIPYGALLPKGAKHIICAGRAVSSDTEANSGLRVEAACMAMGQAAGCAAAIAATDDVALPDVSYSKLVSALNDLGATVPTKE